MSRTKQVAARRLFDFADVVGERCLVNVSVGPSLAPVLLSAEGKADYRLATGHGSFPRKGPDGRCHFRIHHETGDGWAALDLPPTAENCFFAQPLPGGKWLVVRARAGGDRDRNAHVHTADGRLIRSFHAGDGIQDVQTSEDGHVWVGYFDEGVFGSTALGTSGLACLGQGGRPLLRFTDLGDDRLIRSMADCYALNVCSDRETWLYYCTDFPLVRLVDRRLAGSWWMPVRGANGFAVDGARVLLGGSYERKESLFLGEFECPEFQELAPVQGQGSPLTAFRPFGRGRHLYLATEESLHVVDMQDL